MTCRRSRILVAAVSAVAMATVSGCTGASSCASIGTARAAVMASCALAVRYDGATYFAWSHDLPAVKGERLGDGVYPGCNDTGGCGTPDPETSTTVWTLRGVEPDVAVVAREEGRGRFVVYATLHQDPKDIFRHTEDGWQLRNP